MLSHTKDREMVGYSSCKGGPYYRVQWGNQLPTLPAKIMPCLEQSNKSYSLVQNEWKKVLWQTLYKYHSYFHNKSENTSQTYDTL
jgi:hypothetical protein